MEMTDKIAENLREADFEGHIGFSIKAENNDVNQVVHDGFKEFCKYETQDNYTLGLKLLLETWEQFYKLTSIIDAVKELEVRLEALENPKKKEEKKDDDENEVF